MILIPQHFVDRRFVAFRLDRLTVEIVVWPATAFLCFAFRGMFFRFYPGHGSLLLPVQQTECRHRNSIQSLIPTTWLDFSVNCSCT